MAAIKSRLFEVAEQLTRNEVQESLLALLDSSPDGEMVAYAVRHTGCLSVSIIRSSIEQTKNLLGKRKTQKFKEDVCSRVWAYLITSSVKASLPQVEESEIISVIGAMEKKMGAVLWPGIKATQEQLGEHLVIHLCVVSSVLETIKSQKPAFDSWKTTADALLSNLSSKERRGAGDDEADKVTATQLPNDATGGSTVAPSNESD